ncbi:hypothetical protein ABG067_002487 [Albugo candida]
MKNYISVANMLMLVVSSHGATLREGGEERRNTTTTSNGESLEPSPISNIMNQVPGGSRVLTSQNDRKSSANADVRDVPDPTLGAIASQPYNKHEKYEHHAEHSIQRNPFWNDGESESEEESNCFPINWRCRRSSQSVRNIDPINKAFRQIREKFVEYAQEKEREMPRKTKQVIPYNAKE